MLKDYCVKPVFFGRLRTVGIFVTLTLLATLSAQIHFVSAESLPAETSKIGFVAFDRGEYRLEHPDQIDKVFNQLQTFPEGTQIHLIGHSHSNKSQASSKLATMRATSVRDQLIASGVAVESISVDYDVRNSVPDGQLLQGVSVLVLKPQSREEDEELQEQVVPTPGDSEVYLCNQVNINSGSLSANIAREIGDCGYIMGRWRFGSGDEVIDWHVPVAYNTTVDDGIVDLLQLIERNYQIRAHIHKLDKSIDFFPSIRDRGSSK